MTREELIAHLEHLAEYVKYSEDAPALREVIEMLKTHEERTETHACDLPQSTMGQVNDTVQSTNDCISRQLLPAQPDHIAEVSKKVDADLISRQAAIDALSTPHGILYPIRTIEELPFAQPEVRTQMSSADWQAAIEALKALEEKPKALEDDYDFGRRQMLETCIDIIQDLQPSTSAQPEIIKCRDCEH